MFGEVYKEHFFAFNVLSIVVFFNTLISVLYYLGVMQLIIRNIGRFLAFCLGTTPAESLNATGNIFVGMTQAGLIIRPYLNTLTMSELFAVITGGFSTVAGSVLGAYIGFWVSANHLISASVMSAPAALAMAKIVMPDTEKTSASSKDYYITEKSKERNLIEAASAGALESIKLCGAIAVNVIAFLWLLEMVNQTLVWFGDQVGVKGFTLEDKSEVIATYALCGFSNINSIGVMLGGLGALAPSRRSDMTKIVFKAMVAGNVACFLTACIAGLLYEDYE